MAGKAKEFIKIFEKQAYQKLTAIEKEQHPFVLAKSLTQIAKGAMFAVKQKTRQEFDLKSEFIPKSIRFSGANVKQMKDTGKANSFVFTMDRIQFMSIHEEGGEREPFSAGTDDKGRSFTIPSEMIEGKHRTSRGRVRKRYKPKELLKNYQGRTTRARPQGKAKRTKEPFIIRAKESGVPMIVRRTTKKRYPLKILYIFSSRVKYSPEWEFEDTVVDYVERSFPSLYKRNMQLAIRS